MTRRKKFKMSKNSFKKICRQFKWRCAYCQKHMTKVKKRKLTKDHMTPMVKGGKTKHNIVPACISCNSHKGDMLPLDFFNSEYMLRFYEWRNVYE